MTPLFICGEIRMETILLILEASPVTTENVVTPITVESTSTKKIFILHTTAPNAVQKKTDKRTILYTMQD